MKYIGILLFIVFINPNSFAQTLVESGDIYLKLKSINDGMPGAGGEDYIEPTATEMMSWAQLLEWIWEKDLMTASVLATQLHYDLIAFTDTTNNNVYYILQSKEINGNYWGTYVFNPFACQTNLVIQSPHPKFDTNTGKQGAWVFRDVSASVFMLSGTHRCNSSTLTNCSGTTSVCGSSSAYPITDVAHNINSMFQITHEFLHDRNPDVYFIQLHGFSWNSSLPYIIMSNGTSIVPTVDKISELGMALVATDPTLTYGVEHITPALPLSGSTNTQGRYTNNSPNPCTVSANFNSGRFFHLEQEKTKLRESSTEWDKVTTALNVVFRNLYIENTMLETGCFQAKDTLIANATILSTETIRLEAGHCIELQSDFEILQGAEVLIQIENCGL